ncbi:hypothetical protein ACIRVF_42615 [Kitasatospora sp. NPDC101157]|uniref:hypothetical protein n=1 Tax=Kitasatospora sp. NPDC101157 TaxID=3364098 RepID=UPI003808E556
MTAYYWGMLKVADFGGLTTTANALTAYEGHFKHRIAEWRKMLQDLADCGWHGEAQQAADDALRHRTSQLYVLEQLIEDLRVMLSDAADSLLVLQTRQKTLVETAAASGLQILDGGVDTAPTVQILPPSKSDEGGQHDPEWLKAMETTRDRLAKEIGDLSTEVKGVDDSVAAALSRIDHTFQTGWAVLPDEVVEEADKDAGAIDKATDGRIGVPSPMDPAGNAKWWASLPESTRQQLIQDHPGEIGGLSGLPAATRDQANRLFLPRLREQIAKDLSDENPDLRANPKLHVTQANLDGLDALQKQIDTKTVPPQLLLGLGDPVNQNVSTGAVLAYGNPDTATNIAAYVPPHPAVGTLAADTATARGLAVAAGKADPAHPTAALVFVSLGAPADPMLTPSSLPGRPLREGGASGTFQGLAVSHQGRKAIASEVSAVPQDQGSGFAVARVPLDRYVPGVVDPCTPDAVVARTPGGIEDPASHHAIVNAIVGRG